MPVILCGGSGTRLWPLSRASFPKQYLEINSKESKSFLQETITRLNSYKDIDNPIVICNEEHRFIVAEQLRKVNIKAKSILLEPIGRNTAPAITIACLKAIENANNPYVLVLPSDHIIQDSKTFFKVVEKAITYLEEEKIITFGISPNKPETGYGYIESENPLDPDALNGEKILRFIEKPSKKKAQELISDNRFSWNSGIFLFKANTFLSEISVLSPKIFEFCKNALLSKNFDLDFQRLDKNYFSKCENISIDKAIMEKTDLGIVLPLKAGWSDIGNWQSMWDVSNKDRDSNILLGKVFIENVKKSYIRSENRLIVGIGLEDLIIVETVDALLVAKKDQTQNVKNVVRALELKGESEANTHKTIFRPWGHYTSIAGGANWQLKKIIVKSSESLSLQKHNHRTEHWIVVSGIALVEINGKKNILEKNQSTFIPLSAKHRLSNPGKENLVLIEIQSGDYLGEDDIIRFDDKYGRENL